MLSLQLKEFWAKYLSDYHHNGAPVTKVPSELFLLALSQSPSLCVLFEFEFPRCGEGKEGD